ncbi:MAG: YciI family protein [Saprospiraceae bacterium]
MKSIYSLIIVIPFLFLLGSCQPDVKAVTTKTEETVSTMVYDSVLASNLGADEYGMKHYVLAFLRKGPNRNQDSIKTAQVMRKHLDNIKRMADEGKLAIAGPCEDDGEIRGIYIFNVATIEEAKALTETDPAIQEGRLAMELHPWYGSAALMTVPETHKKIAKSKI